jgi:hypothetical protein
MLKFTDLDELDFQQLLVVLATGALPDGSLAVPWGATPGKLVSVAGTNASVIKGSPGALMMLLTMTTNPAARYLKLFNKATAPTLGTDVPIQTYTIPGNSAGAGVAIPLPRRGLAFTNGIAMALTTGIADLDTNGVAANEIVVNWGVL